MWLYKSKLSVYARLPIRCISLLVRVDKTEILPRVRKVITETGTRRTCDVDPHW